MLVGCLNYVMSLMAWTSAPSYTSLTVPMGLQVWSFHLVASLVQVSTQFSHCVLSLPFLSLIFFPDLMADDQPFIKSC